MAPRGRPLQLRCSCLKNSYSARQASTSLPLNHPFSSSPSSSKLTVEVAGARLSQPMRLAAQKELNPCPIRDRAVTVKSTKFVNSSEFPHLPVKLIFQIIATNIVESHHLTCDGKKILLLYGRKSGVSRCDILLPFLHKRQTRTFPYFLQQAVD